MTYKIIYIDDEPNKDVIGPYINDFKTSGEFDIVAKSPTDFRTLFEDFEKNDFDALILDYKLSEYANPGEDDKTNIYDAPALAQELRTKAIENDSAVVEVPIILFSSIDYLKKYYEKDLVSHDLFDMIFKKDELHKIKDDVILKIKSVILSYQRIREGLDTDNLLGKGSDQYLDPRFVEYLEIHRATHAIYSVSIFIFRKLIMVEGGLVDQETLASRLGVDKQSSQDWDKLISMFDEHKYTGVFHETYERWWWRGIEKWWKSVESPNLKGSNAEIRLDSLKKRTKLSLKGIDKIDLARGSSFWSLCQKLEKPIDPIDGFKIRGSSLHPWVENRYYSLKALLEYPDLIDHLQEADRKRFNEIKREIN